MLSPKELELSSRRRMAQHDEFIADLHSSRIILRTVRLPRLLRFAFSGVAYAIGGLRRMAGKQAAYGGLVKAKRGKAG